MRRPTTLLAACALIVAAAMPGGVRAMPAQGPELVPPAGRRAMLESYCFPCHNQKLRTGGLALEGLDVTDVTAGAPTWEKVIRKLRSGAMPPPGRPRPDPATRDAFTA